MTSIVLGSTTSQWQRIIHEAGESCHLQLNEEMESYLVFLMMRFQGCPEVVESVVAIEYLHSQLATGRIKQDQLREVGDRCLLFSGFFPKRAHKRRVKISYFVEIGRSAYHQLADHSSAQIQKLYLHLAQGFVPLMDVLQTVRQMGQDSPILEPLEAIELWQDTGSKSALASLRNHTDSLPVSISTNSNIKH